MSGLDLGNMQVGERLVIQGPGGEIILEITQIGKECPKPCNIYYQMGSCIMPKEGIFCRVLKAGAINKGDKILSGEDI